MVQVPDFWFDRYFWCKAEVLHTKEQDPSVNLPYAPAIKVSGGSTVYLAGVTAAKTYHHHPRRAGEFEDIPGGG